MPLKRVMVLMVMMIMMLMVVVVVVVMMIMVVTALAAVHIPVSVRLLRTRLVVVRGPETGSHGARSALADGADAAIRVQNARVVGQDRVGRRQPV